MARTKKPGGPPAQLPLFAELGEAAAAPKPPRKRRKPAARRSVAGPGAVVERMLDEAIAAERATHGTVLPPWRRYPDEPRFAGFWYQGAGEWYVMVWSRWAESLDEAARVAYFDTYRPLPVEWADWVASAVYGGREHATDDEIAEEVRRLEREHGLVDAAAWERWLAGP